MKLHQTYGSDSRYQEKWIISEDVGEIHSMGPGISKVFFFQSCISFLLYQLMMLFYVLSYLPTLFWFLRNLFLRSTDYIYYESFLGFFIHVTGREVDRNVHEKINVVVSMHIYLGRLNYLQASDLWKLYQAFYLFSYLQEKLHPEDSSRVSAKETSIHMRHQKPYRYMPDISPY